jgi:prevent-host-death family protein
MLTVNLTHARNHLSEIADEIINTQQQVTVTRNGAPSMVWLSADEYEGLMTTLEILRDPQAVTDLHQAETENRRGENYTLNELNRAMAERRAREEYDRRANQ